MTAIAKGSPLFYAHTSSGAPLVGGKVFTYAAGTTTLKPTFADAVGVAANTNPVMLNARGEASIYWSAGLYKVRVEDAAGVLVYEIDNFDPQIDSAPTQAMNLISNGSFEADADGDGQPDGWAITAYLGGSVSLDRYDVDLNPLPDTWEGEAALKFVHPGGIGNGGGYADSGRIEVSESSEYLLSFAIKSSIATTHNAVDLLWFNAANGLLATTTPYSEIFNNPTAWAEKSYVVTPPVGARFVAVRLHGGVNDEAQGGTVRYDNVRLSRVENRYLRSDVDDTVAGTLTLDGATGSLAAKTTNGGIEVARTGFAFIDLKALGGATADRVRLNFDSNGNFSIGNIDNPGAGGIDFSATVVSINGQPAWHAGNDGPGSGLNADMLDGLQESSFVRSDAADTVSGNLTFTATPKISTGFPALLGEDTGLPVDAGGLWEMALGNDSFQVLRNTHPTALFSTFDLVLRAHPSLFEWMGNTVWHAGNDGAGSGLDADLIDGLESNQFLRSDVAGTVAGPLSISGIATALKLLAGATSDHVYLSFYPDSQDQATRKAWIGFGSAGSTALAIFNQFINGNLELATTGTGVVMANGNRVLTVADEGAGNGLDADTVDGLQASQFVRSDANSTLSGILTVSALYPVIHFSDTSLTPATNGEYGIDAANGSLLVFTRDAVGGGVLKDAVLEASPSLFTWMGNRVLTVADEGAGNGLDADTLDGVQGAGYALAGHAHGKSEFSVHQNGVAHMVLGNTDAKIRWPTEEFDTNNDFALDRFTPTIAGKYMLSAQVTLSNPFGVSSLAWIKLYKNGLSYKHALWHFSGAAGAPLLQIQAVVDANGSSDYFEIFVRQSDAANNVVTDASSAATFFTGALIR